MSRRPGLAGLAALAAAGALTGVAGAADGGHGGGTGDVVAPAPVAGAPEATDPAAARGVAVTDRAVVPQALVVPPGARITWTNVGRNRHTVTADDGAFESGTLPGGAAFSIAAPAAVGRYGYFCRFHGFIRGSLTVSPLALEAPESVAFGRRALLRGTVPGAPAGTEVVIERRLPGRWERVAVALTGADGAFRARSPALRAATAFRAVAGDALSPSVRARVRPALVAHRSGALLHVVVRPSRRGAPLVLERLDLDTYRWVALARARLVPEGYGVVLRRPGVYRVRAEAHRGLAEGGSAPMSFRAASFRQ